MNKIFRWYYRFSNRAKKSLMISATSVGMLSTILSILGISLEDFKIAKIWIRVIIVISLFVLLFCVVYTAIGIIYKKSINTKIRNTPISICCGDIFKISGLRVIGCDTHFDTRIDDIVIAKKSLHGKLFVEHGETDEIKMAVESEANRLGLQKNSMGLYDFPLGTIIRYNSSVDNNTYLLLAMIRLNDQFEAHTNMAEFEYMLMRMWKEIDRVYACREVVLPLLGTGISRFDDGPKQKRALLRCMLCTLNSSGVTLNSTVKIVLYGDNNDIPLYEYKDIYKQV
ncbi:MAG: hypothetical protein IJG23_05740 [Clostridia bacterium]|nr:hypothetical protein [Clostridia bacterium]